MEGGLDRRVEWNAVSYDLRKGGRAMVGGLQYVLRDVVSVCIADGLKVETRVSMATGDRIK